MIRVVLPYHLRKLAGTESKEVVVSIDDQLTVGTLLDRVEREYPALRGAIRDHASHQRRRLVRFFVDGQDWSHVPHSTPLPESIRTAREPFLIIGAMAGG